MNSSAEHLEVEVKFFLNQPEKMQQRIVALGATSQPKMFETNLRLEDSGHTLKANNKLLRLRKDRSSRLTFKCKPSSGTSECKVYRELEVEINDFDMMKDIFAELGYRPVQIYEKWRQTYQLKDVELCMDTMPYGTFLEIEGPEESIKTTAQNLKLAWEDRILSNYLAIFQMLRTHSNLPFNDVTFANFEKNPADITPILASLKAGAPE